MSTSIRNGLAVLSVGVLIVLITGGFDSLIAQPPPALPGAPEQAPLGGIAVLAAAGGAYAWRKLRNKV